MTIKLSKKSELKLVYIHGWGGSSKSLQPLSGEVEKLLRQTKIGSQKLIIELPGFGETKLDHEFRFEDYMDYVQKRINEFAVEDENLILVGHSFGGKILTGLTSRGKFPLSKLILIDVSSLRPKFSLKRTIIYTTAKVYSPIKALMFAVGLGGMQMNLQKAFYKYIVRARDYQKIDATGDENLKKTFQNVVHIYQSPEEISKITNKTLILWGENDKDTPVWMAHKLHALLPDSQLHIFPDATHGLPLRMPEACAQQIVKFITKSNEI